MFRRIEIQKLDLRIGKQLFRKDENALVGCLYV